MIRKIRISFNNWRNKRAERRVKAKWLNLYFDSVGHTYISDNGFGEGLFNKDKYARPLWNRKVKPISAYQLYRRQQIIDGVK